MKKKILLFSFSIITIFTYSQTAKVVGYLPTYRFSASTQIDYCKLTHLNLCFANPDSEGNIVMPDISSVIADAKNDNPDIVICISLAGAGLTSEQVNDWSNLIDAAANRPAFISKIVDYVLANNLDGVDVDLEWGLVTSGYSDFVVELDAALNTHNKIHTVAFPNQTLYSNVNEAALEAFDFINIMSYDATGPWNPSSPGQHSSYNFASNGINFWKNTVGISGTRLTLGVPFYGYDFVNSSTVNAFTYASMVDDNQSYADQDNVGTAYYNGRPTIGSKVDLANDEVGGIMIWELGQDSFDQYSLLTTIHEKYTSLGITTTGLCGNESVSIGFASELHDKYEIYPNPASNYFILKHEDAMYMRVEVTNTLGQLFNIRTISKNNNELYFDLSNIENGLYFITIINKDNKPTTLKLIVN